MAGPETGHCPGRAQAVGNGHLGLDGEAREAPGQIIQHGPLTAKQMRATGDIKADAVGAFIAIKRDPGAVAAAPIGQAGQGAAVFIRRHMADRQAGRV